MMDDYSKDLDRLHAPESLIEKTLQAVAEAEQAQNGDTGKEVKENRTAPARIKPFRTRRILTAVAAAAAILLIGGGVYSMNRDTYRISQMEAISVTRGGITELSQVSAEEYKELTGVDVLGMINEETYVNGDFEVLLEDEVVTDDLATLTLQIGDGRGLLMLSKTKLVMPDMMSDLPSSRISGYSVILVESEEAEGMAYYATGEKDDISYYLYVRDCEEEEFQTILKKFLSDETF